MLTTRAVAASASFNRQPLHSSDIDSDSDVVPSMLVSHLPYEAPVPRLQSEAPSAVAGAPRAESKAFALKPSYDEYSAEEFLDASKLADADVDAYNHARQEGKLADAMRATAGALPAKGKSLMYFQLRRNLDRPWEPRFERGRRNFGQAPSDEEHAQAIRALSKVLPADRVESAEKALFNNVWTSDRKGAPVVWVDFCGFELSTEQLARLQANADVDECLKSFVQTRGGDWSSAYVIFPADE